MGNVFTHRERDEPQKELSSDDEELADLIVLPDARSAHHRIPLLDRLLHRHAPEISAGSNLSPAPAPVAKPVAPPRVARSYAPTMTGDICCRDWRAWREPGRESFTAVLHVTVNCHLPANYAGSRVFLQEAVRSCHEEQEWGDFSGGTPLLVLERIVVPPPVDCPKAVSLPKGMEEIIAPLSFQKAENFMLPASIPGALTWGTQACTRHRYVAILPDKIVLQIEE